MATGWIKVDGCDYLLDKQGKLQTKSYRNSDGFVIFDRYHNYAWLDLKQAADAFANLTGKDLEVPYPYGFMQHGTSHCIIHL